MADVLIRGVDKEVVEYLDGYRKRRWGQTRTALIRGILEAWVKEEKRKDVEDPTRLQRYGY